MLKMIKSKPISGGAYGTYYKFSNQEIGIKILRTDKNSLASEYCYYLRASGHSLAPRIYGILKFRNNLFGIVVQHVETYCKDGRYNYSCKIRGIASKLRKKLTKIGLHCDDLHCKNLGIIKNQIVLIDFGPNGVEPINQKIDREIKGESCDTDTQSQHSGFRR